MDQTASAHQKILWQFRECSQVTNMDRHFGLCPRCHRQETPQSGCLALHFITDIVPHAVRENVIAASI